MLNTHQEVLKTFTGGGERYREVYLEYIEQVREWEVKRCPVLAKREHPLTVVARFDELVHISDNTRPPEPILDEMRRRLQVPMADLLMEETNNGNPIRDQFYENEARFRSPKDPVVA